jgi:imidazoleglycerol phosphate synthase glutamine amidotransferase subunit HisH
MTLESKLVQLYLRSLQAAALRSIPDACARYGVDANFAAQIADLSIQDMEKLCMPGVVQFRPAMPGARMLQLMQIADTYKRNIVARLLIPVDATKKTVAAKPLPKVRKGRKA